LPIGAAVVAFGAAFTLGMSTKSSSGTPTGVSLAAPISIPAPQASVPALQRAVSVPSLKPRARPVSRPRTSPGVSVAPAQSTSSASSGITNTPPSGVVHGESNVPSGVVHSSGGGGSGVVHGGN
jgi:hypothetical protein